MSRMFYLHLLSPSSSHNIITAAGTVFAITGGLAAPANVGNTGASSAVTFVAAVLLLPAATTIFGVGGGTLVASNDGSNNNKKNNSNENPELSRTVDGSKMNMTLSVRLAYNLAHWQITMNFYADSVRYISPMLSLIVMTSRRSGKERKGNFGTC